MSALFKQNLYLKEMASLFTISKDPENCTRKIENCHTKTSYNGLQSI